MLKLFIIFMLLIVKINSLSAQSSYGYGTVIGGQKTGIEGGVVTSFINDNVEGIRVVLIQSAGSSIRGIGRVGGGVRLLDIPKDTDYLELIMFYSGIDPRSIRKDKIKILRVASNGQTPYLSKDIQRYWTTYNFGEQYDRGGPFDLVRPYDIILIQQRGLFNREFFDPLTDVTFLLTLPTVLFSIISVYNAFIK